jgi:hypothetical protein
MVNNLDMNKIENWLIHQNQRPCFWLGLFLLLVFIQIDSYWWTMNSDVAAYLSIARSVWTNQGITCFGEKQLYFSPGYPLLISPAFLISSKPFLYIGLINGIFASLFVLGVYRWMRSIVPEAALWLTGLSIMNVSFGIIFRALFSETSFMAVAIWTIIMLNASASSADSTKTWVWAIPGSIMLVLLSAIRYPGLLVGFAFAIALFFQVRKHNLKARKAVMLAAVVTLPALLTVTTLLIYERANISVDSVRNGMMYTNQIFAKHSSLSEQILEGLRLRISSVGRLLLPGMFKTYGRAGQWLNPSMIIYIPLTCLIIYGWWKLLRRKPEVFGLMFPIYLLLYIIWPYDQGTRFLLPMLPLLWACLWMYLRRFQIYRLRIITLLLLLHTLILIGYWQREIPDTRQWKQAWPLVEEIASIIGSQNGLAVYEIPPNIRIMLKYEIDIPITVLSEINSNSIPLKFQWILTKNNIFAPGFIEYGSFNKFHLLCRSSRITFPIPH